jgi:hypothetical protein
LGFLAASDSLDAFSSAPLYGQVSATHVMCPWGVGTTGSGAALASSATKSSTTQKAAYVPKHISGEFFKALGIRERIGLG